MKIALCALLSCTLSLSKADEGSANGGSTDSRNAATVGSQYNKQANKKQRHTAQSQHSNAYTEIRIHDKVFRSITVQPKKLSLHWKDTSNLPYRTLGNVKTALEKQGKKVSVLMNAGIYGLANTPAGLHIESGKVHTKLNQRHGKGNFHIQPNGVFLVKKNNIAKIVTTASYQKYFAKHQNQIRLATQSGPMLLINGTINRQLKPTGTSEYTRNGICTTKAGEVRFIATETFPVTESNLYLFAKAAQQFGCYQALYLDGSISKMYIKGKDSTFHFREFVGILAVEE